MKDQKAFRISYASSNVLGLGHLTDAVGFWFEQSLCPTWVLKSMLIVVKWRMVVEA